MKSGLLFLSSVILSASLFSIGYLSSKGLKYFRSGNRTVTVKGVSEREVEADKAYWTIRHLGKGDTFETAKENLNVSKRKVRDYLASFGISDDQIRVRRVEIREDSAPDEHGRYVKKSFTMTENLMIRSNNPKIVESAAQSMAKLIDEGVFIEGSYNPDFEPFYSFTRLNEFKPEMIAEATKNARNAAEQFADDSNSRVGSIKKANQGLFQILGRDKIIGLSEYSQREKTLRVVVTLDYFIE